MSKAKVSWLLCIGRLVSKTDSVMHFARLVEQASAAYLSMELTGRRRRINKEAKKEIKW